MTNCFPAPRETRPPPLVAADRSRPSRTVEVVPAVRSVIDYALVRRALLADLFAGRVSATDVCDAHPYLLRAARFHGERTDVACPVCRKEELTHVTYAYGDALGYTAGRARGRDEVADLSRSPGDVRVYVVEVCRGCSWNHLVTSYLTGRHVKAEPRRGSISRRPARARADS
jgi:hypothetical protein